MAINRSIDTHAALFSGLGTLLAILLAGLAWSPAAPSSPHPAAIADDDQDGIPNLYDICPGASNLGTPDLDGDGLVDHCDLDADGDGAYDHLALLG